MNRNQEKDSRRLMNKNEKDAAKLFTDIEGDGDHIVPHHAGGKTSVENCQILTKKQNLKKGGFIFVPRRWQSEAIESWGKRDSSKEAFMLIAIPAGGKTWLSLEIARQWTAAGTDRRILVIVPTIGVREQWRDDAELFGMSLQTKEFGTSFKDEFKGGVTTYQSVSSSTSVYKKLCSVSPVLVIFDEIHHCGTEARFGESVREAFELSKERLLLSGTPWKTDGSVIPYVRYDENGHAIGDYVYDYPKALIDAVVRYLVFDYSKGAIKNDVTGDTEILSKDISDYEAQKRLRKLLDPDGNYIKELISQAHVKLMDIRRTIPDAGGLIACIDQFHATKVAKVVKEVTGCEPSLIVSDTELENDTVAKFRKSKKEWLVAVKKVSEGTDIKRLQVLCYLTNTISEIFFRQLIGRVSRVREMEDFEAYVYLPADPRLIKRAENIQNLQAQALLEIAENESREYKEGENGSFEFDSYSTSHIGTDLVLVGGERITSAEAKIVENISAATDTDMNKVLMIMRMSGSPPIPINETASENEPLISKEAIYDSLRKKCNQKAFRLSKLLDVQVQDIHGKFKSQTKMNEAELKSKLETLLSQISKWSEENGNA